MARACLKQAFVGQGAIVFIWTAAQREPSPVNAGCGYLGWLNTGRHEWPAAPESSYAAVGAGTSILWIDPDNDLILVARWIDR